MSISYEFNKDLEWRDLLAGETELDQQFDVVVNDRSYYFILKIIESRDEDILQIWIIDDQGNSWSTRIGKHLQYNPHQQFYIIVPEFVYIREGVVELEMWVSWQ